MDPLDFSSWSLSENAIDDKKQGTKNVMSLLICLKPEDDFPHPRYLCFRYPFGKTSPKRHCKKCYCYVCDELAPCKKWNKPPKGHCHATVNDEKWILERQLTRKKVPSNPQYMAHHKLTVSLAFDPPGQLVKGCCGGVICNGYGDWNVGFAMRIHNNVDTYDCSVPPYTVLCKGLHLAWSKGFRCLEVQLGFLLRDVFWFDFTMDDTGITRKFHLRVNPSLTHSHQVCAILKDVEDYLNREWLIDVKNCSSSKEEGCALATAAFGDSQMQDKKVIDFSTHPLTAHVMEIAQRVETNRSGQVFAPCLSMEERKYFGFA